ncbi:MAG: (d)CMP kinase [Myxococcota bacterium]
MSRTRPVVAIDGPAGAGKSSVSKQVAEELGFIRVDTGALYRGVALLAREQGIAWSDGEAVATMARNLDLRFEAAPGGAALLIVNGRDRTSELRTPEISEGASEVSKHPPVRDALLGLQRALGEGGGVVLEGRDIGTVVFPDAEVKIFLTASVRERARRRLRDLEAQGIEADLAQTQAAMEARDAQDSSRAVAPLRPAEDATVVDCTDLGFGEVVARLVELVRAHETP